MFIVYSNFRGRKASKATKRSSSDPVLAASIRSFHDYDKAYRSPALSCGHRNGYGTSVGREQKFCGTDDGVQRGSISDLDWTRCRYKHLVGSCQELDPTTSYLFSDDKGPGKSSVVRVLLELTDRMLDYSCSMWVSSCSL